MIQINWVRGFGYAKTSSGKKACISPIYQTSVGGDYYSLYIEGDKRNAATRATLEKIQKILQSR